MQDLNPQTRLIRDLAQARGFSYCGFAPAAFLQEEAKQLELWLSDGLHGDMSWMERNFDKRVDPRKLEPGTRSVIVLMQNYYPGELPIPASGIRISKYALGRDYHKVLKQKMKTIIDEARLQLGDFQARAFVDSAPVMERAWARQAGLGWQGKNSLTLVKRGGSFFFLGIILTDLVFDYSKPLQTNYCGSCSLCIDACPTGAIIKPGVIDARRCISYLTIELHEAIPEEFRSRMQGWVFGCDTCQDVCPHNKRYSIAHREPDFGPREILLNLSRREWLEMEEMTFDRVFSGSAVKRAGYEGFMRNLRLEGSEP